MKESKVRLFSGEIVMGDGRRIRCVFLEGSLLSGEIVL